MQENWRWKVGLKVCNGGCGRIGACSSARKGSRQMAQSPQLSSRPRDAAAAASQPSRLSRDGGAGTSPCDSHTQDARRFTSSEPVHRR